jgi:hypothetical protein
MNALTVITAPATALPTTILADLDADARQSLSAATRTTYESDWRAFEGWCDPRASMPCPRHPPLWRRSRRLRLTRGSPGEQRPALCRSIRHFHYLAGVDPAPTDVATVKSIAAALQRIAGHHVLRALGDRCYRRRLLGLRGAERVPRPSW